MKKFAFYTKEEADAFIGAVKLAAPKEFHAELLALAQVAPPTLNNPDIQTSVPRRSKSAAEERLSELRDTLREFLAKVNLHKDPAAFQWIDSVVEQMRPSLESSLKGQSTLEDQLSMVPKLPESKAEPQHDIVGPEEYNLLEPITAPKPPIVPKNQKLSPRSNSSMLRNTAGADWSLEKMNYVPDKLDEMITAMLAIADSADEAGLHDEADALAHVLPAVRTVKMAQYEGFQNYWIANGRAFEMAYKQKRSKGKDSPEDFRSPQEVWFEILEEYQKSLLTNQHDFISKYAGRSVPVVDRAASRILVGKISARIESGSSPGVALYESVDLLSSGQHIQIVADQMQGVLRNIAKAASDKNHVVLAQEATGLADTASKWFGKLMRGLGFNYGNPTTTLAERLDDAQKGRLIGRLGDLYEKAKAAEAAGKPLSSAQLHGIIYPLYEGVGEFIDRAKLVGLRGTPDLPDISMAIQGDAISANGLARFTNLLDSGLKFVRPDTAAKIDQFIYNRWPSGLKMPASTYLEHFRGAPPAGTAGQQSAQPQQQAQQPMQSQPAQQKDMKTTVSEFHQAFSMMPPDGQFDVITNVVKMVNDWYKSPAGIAEMVKRKQNPAGQPYPKS